MGGEMQIMQSNDSCYNITKLRFWVFICVCMFSSCSVYVQCVFSVCSVCTLWGIQLLSGGEKKASKWLITSDAHCVSHKRTRICCGFFRLNTYNITHIAVICQDLATICCQMEWIYVWLLFFCFCFFAFFVLSSQNKTQQAQVSKFDPPAPPPIAVHKSQCKGQTEVCWQTALKALSYLSATAWF